MEQKKTEKTTYTNSPATAAGGAHTELKPEYTSTSGPGVVESMKEMGHSAMEKMKGMTGMQQHEGQGMAGTSQSGMTTGTTHAGMTSGMQQQPGMMESAKQSVGHAMERGKEMLGMGQQTTGQRMEQQAHAAKESMTGAAQGAQEGAQAGFQAGEKPYVHKGMAASAKEAGEKAKPATGMDKSSTGSY